MRHGLPVMLEGETCASKTISIRWVARLLSQPAIRLNLNGQSDTSELVGRYVPGGAAHEKEAEALVFQCDQRNGKKCARRYSSTEAPPGVWSKWEPSAINPLIASKLDSAWPQP